MFPAYSGPIWLVMSISVLLARSIALVGSQKEDAPFLHGFSHRFHHRAVLPFCTPFRHHPRCSAGTGGLAGCLGRSHGGGTGRVSALAMRPPSPRGLGWLDKHGCQALHIWNGNVGLFVLQCPPHIGCGWMWCFFSCLRKERQGRETLGWKTVRTIRISWCWQ